MDVDTDLLEIGHCRLWAAYTIKGIMAGYNLTRLVEELLDKTEPSPPSFSVHLHPEYWTLNSGSKFLYNNQIAVSGSLLARQWFPV